MQTFKQKHEKQPYLCPQGLEAVINCKRDPNQISQCSGFVSKLSPGQHWSMLSHGQCSAFVEKLSPGQHSCSLSHRQFELNNHISPVQHSYMLSHRHHSWFVKKLSPGQHALLLSHRQNALKGKTSPGQHSCSLSHSEFLSMSALVCRAVRAATMKSLILLLIIRKLRALLY